MILDYSESVSKKLEKELSAVSAFLQSANSNDESFGASGGSPEPRDIGCCYRRHQKRSSPIAFVSICFAQVAAVPPPYTKLP